MIDPEDQNINLPSYRPLTKAEIRQRESDARVFNAMAPSIIIAILSASLAVLSILSLFYAK